MEWLFTINFNRKLLKLKGKVISRTASIEQITVIARNRSITIEGNRPLLESKGLKQRRINWKVVDGTLSNHYLLELITKAVETKLRGT